MKRRSEAKLGEVGHRWLVPAAGMLFLVAGGAKLISVFEDAKILKFLDPVLRLPWWLLMSTAGMVNLEFSLAELLAVGKRMLAACQNNFRQLITIWICMRRIIKESW